MDLMNNNILRALIFLVFFLVFLTACSSSKINQNNQNHLNTKDSFEKFNRCIFAFNVRLDDYLLKPTAKAYKAMTPDIVDTGIGNFFDNLGDVGNIINNVLQFKINDAVNDTERFVINSTFGFSGLLDIASAAGLEKHEEDFGQTLARWGVKSGPYVMLPFLGPSTIRDASAKITIDRLIDPAHYSDQRSYLFIAKTIKKRADFLSEEEVIKGLSDDTYSALRDVWLQRRDFLIRDGKVNPNSDSDLIDELESLESE